MGSDTQDHPKLRRRATDVVQLELSHKLQSGFMLGDKLIYPQKGLVVHEDTNYHLNAKAMEVLLVLCTHSGTAVTREVLLNQVWGDSQCSASNLSHAITEIRHVLHDDKSCPTYIQTFPRKGYRLIVPPRPITDSLLSGDIWRLPDGLAPAISDASNEAKTIKRSKKRYLPERHLFKLAAAYIVVSWVLVQVMSITLPILNAPAWSDKVVLLVVIALFPVVLIYAWWVELRVRLRFVKQQQDMSARHHVVRRGYRDLMYIGVLFGGCSIGSLYLYEQINHSTPLADTSRNVALQQAKVFNNAVAVLPYQSKGTTQSDPLSDILQSELLTFLSQSPQLRVIAERVMSALPQHASLALIRDRTGARYVIEGYINHEQDSLWVITTMTDSITGFQIWANKFEADHNNNLVIYETLSHLVFNALNFLMPRQQDSKNVRFKPTDDFEAYNFYMQAKVLAKNAYDEQTLKQVEKLYLSALENDHNFELAESGLCQTYLEQYKLLKVNQIFDMARQSCQTAMAKSANPAESEIALGNLFLLSGDYQQAQQHFKQALSKQPDNSNGLTGLAEVYQQLSQDDAAEKMYQRAIQAEPGYWRNYQSYGSYLFSHGRYLDATMQYQKQTILQPNSEEAFNNLGAAYYLQTNFTKATQAWQRALAIKPSGIVYSNLGTSLFFSMKYTEAAAMYEKAVALNNGDFVLKGNWADALKLIPGQEIKAREIFHQALNQALTNSQINPNDALIQANIARYYSELKQCQKAVPYEQKIIRQQPEDPYIFYDLALYAHHCATKQDVLRFLMQTLHLGYPRNLLIRDHQFAQYQPALKHLLDTQTSNTVNNTL